MSHYKGIWSFAPLSQPTTYVVEANNEEEATEMLGAWACEHRNYIDEPWDFEVEELDSNRFELSQMICAYDEYYDSIWTIYEITKNPEALEEMTRNYVGILKQKSDIGRDFATYTVKQRIEAGYAIEKLDRILQLIDFIIKE